MSRRYADETPDRFNPSNIYRAPNTSGDTLEDPDPWAYPREYMTDTKGSVQNGTSGVEPMNETPVYGNKHKAR